MVLRLRLQDFIDGARNQMNALPGASIVGVNIWYSVPFERAGRLSLEAEFLLEGL